MQNARLQARIFRKAGIASVAQPRKIPSSAYSFRISRRTPHAKVEAEHAWELVGVSERGDVEHGRVACEHKGFARHPCHDVSMHVKQHSRKASDGKPVSDHHGFCCFQPEPLNNKARVVSIMGCPIGTYDRVHEHHWKKYRCC